jgi:outer membrane protein
LQHYQTQIGAVVARLLGLGWCCWCGIVSAQPWGENPMAALAERKEPAFGFSFDDGNQPLLPSLHEPGAWFSEQGFDRQWRMRLFYGAYVDHQLNEIVTLRKGFGPGYDAHIAGVEISRMLYSRFNDWPLNWLWQVGLTRYLENDHRRDHYGMNFMLKGEWTAFPWNPLLRTRVDFSEGLSNALDVPYYESIDTRRKNDGRDSSLMNFLGFSLGISLGDLTGQASFADCYGGLYVYHRSGVFGLVDDFNHVRGGSNYESVYLECPVPWSD